MSLQYAAEAVRSKGRGEDTMLVHMTPGEVKGLQQLAMAYGGSLSTNPETGLPEAGFLKSLLPTLIGVGLAATGMGPLAAGLTVGGIETVRTGDLGRGLMAGLGAYGGAGLASGLQTAGAQASKAGSLSSLGGSAGDVAASTYTAPTTVGGRFAEMSAGLGNLTGTSGTAATQAAAQAAAEQAGITGTGLATKAGAALIEPLTAPAPMPEVEGVEYNYDGPYKPTERQVRYPGPERDPTDSSEFQYFDVVNPSPGFEPIASSTPLPENTYGPDAPRFAGIPVEMATDPERMRDYQQNPNLYSFAEGGEVNMQNNGFVVDAHTVSELGNGSSNAGMERLAQIGGQPLMGPGDGTSDSIPANIDGIQPAMVARDEVYMPPNAVAAYGGGSLKMGEKKLYKLMEQAHASRKKNGRGQSTGLKQLVA